MKGTLFKLLNVKAKGRIYYFIHLKKIHWNADFRYYWIQMFHIVQTLSLSNILL